MTITYRDIAKKIVEARNEENERLRRIKLYEDNKNHFIDELVTYFDLFYKNVEEIVNVGLCFTRQKGVNESTYTYANTKVKLTISEIPGFTADAKLILKNGDYDFDYTFKLRYEDSTYLWFDEEDNKVDFGYVDSLLKKSIK